MQREAKKGSGDNVPRLGVWGMKSPNVPHAQPKNADRSGADGDNYGRANAA